MYRGYIGDILGLYGYIGMMEKKNGNYYLGFMACMGYRILTTN